MKRFILTKPAEADLQSIKEFLVERAGTRIARRVMAEIRVQIEFLAKNPGAGHIREDLTQRPLKFWPVYAYLIVYAPAAKPLQVMRVLHGKRDIEALLKQT